MKMMQSGRQSRAVVRDARAGAAKRGCLSVTATLDYMYLLIATSCLYSLFGYLHRDGTPSRPLAAVLSFSPLLAGCVFGLRGHVLPVALHVHWGVTNAVAALMPLVINRPEVCNVGAHLVAGNCSACVHVRHAGALRGLL